MCATESPTAGVGAKDRSTIPKGTPSRRDASVPDQLTHPGNFKRRFLDDIRNIGQIAPSGHLVSAARTTPGPETPTLMTQSGSPGPWNAPAIKGLSSGALQNTTSLAAPMQSRSAVSSRRLADHFAHYPDRVHVDPGLGGADVHRRADKFRLCQRPRNGFDQFFISCGKSFVYQSRIAADKVDPHFLCRPVRESGRILPDLPRRPPPAWR